MLKPLRWVASSKKDLLQFPDSVRREIGYALYFAQAGEKHPAARPLKGFHGAGILEVVEDHRKHLPSRLNGEVRQRCLCPSRLSKEI